MYVFLDFCAPAKLYAIIAFLTLLYYIVIQTSVFWVCIKALIFIAWVFALNKMCKKGFTPIAWLLSIIPHIIYLICTVKQKVKTTDH